MANRIKFIVHSLRNHPDHWEEQDGILTHTESKVAVDFCCIKYGGLVYPLKRFERWRVRRALKIWVFNRLHEGDHPKTTHGVTKVVADATEGVSISLRSWKTTTLGVVTLVIGWAEPLLAIYDSSPMTQPNWKIGLAATTAAFGLMLAKDGDKSTEDVGLDLLNRRRYPYRPTVRREYYKSIDEASLDDRTGGY